MVQGKRGVAVITGGCGGMGIACARQFGKSRDLVLADISAERLTQLADRLMDEGYKVSATISGDLGDPTVIDELGRATEAAGPLAAIIHTAGVSSGMADWATIIRTNIVGTNLLLNRLERCLVPGTVGILLASVAGHLAPSDPELDALFDHPLELSFMERVEAVLAAMGGQASDVSFNYSGMSGPAYGMSKRATIRQAQLRSVEWAKKGARIVSISPGIIWTPMGRWEVENGETAAQVLAETPLERWGTAMDVAGAASFLASENAAFITGTDLRVDGGMVPARLGRLQELVN